MPKRHHPADCPCCTGLGGRVLLKLPAGDLEALRRLSASTGQPVQALIRQGIGAVLTAAGMAAPSNNERS